MKLSVRAKALLSLGYIPRPEGRGYYAVSLCLGLVEVRLVTGWGVVCQG